MLNTDIKHYSIKKILGQGGMSIVYLAFDNKFMSNVAIKVLNKEYIYNENIRKRFLAEARNMFRMSHPQIVKVTDLIDENDTVAFVMEYIEGETLKEYLERKGKLNDADITRIFSQMLEAVGYVHEQKLVHRDIKPSNFILDKHGNVKLMDFGIAKNTDASSADYTQTGTGMQMGTPMYMSPEQISETKSVTAQSDIYSLGVVLWQMVMGQKPYDTNTLSNFQLQSLIVHELLPKTKTKYDEIIQKAVSKNLNERYSSCSQLSSEFTKKGFNTTKKRFDKSDQISDKTIVESSNRSNNGNPIDQEDLVKSRNKKTNRKNVNQKEVLKSQDRNTDNGGINNALKESDNKNKVIKKWILLVSLTLICATSLYFIMTQKKMYIRPTNAEDYINMGLTLYAEGDYSGAYEAFDNAVKINQDYAGTIDTIAYYNRGLGALKLGDIPRAIEDFEYLISADAASPTIYSLLVKIYLDRGDTINALDIIKVGQKKYPNDITLITQELNIYLSSGNDIDAYNKNEEALVITPENSVLYYIKGHLSDNMGREDEAINAYKKALALNPDYFDANYNLGAMYFNQGADLSNKANAIPTSKVAEYDAMKKKFETKFIEALPYLEKAHVINPTDVGTMQSLLQLYTRIGDLEKAHQIRKKMEK